MAVVTLRVLEGAERGREYENVPTPVTIGREEGNVVQLNDERVSRFHLKIQEDHDKLVLTDLESTNGTRVNGEEIQLRILRYGDLISVGRSRLLYGSRDQIAERLASLREPNGSDSRRPSLTRSPDSGSGSNLVSLDFELNWTDDPDARATLNALTPPELPRQLSPAQAAQLAEMIEYLHLRMRELLESVHFKEPAEDIKLRERQWQNLLDLQGLLASYLRRIGQPDGS